MIKIQVLQTTYKIYCKESNIIFFLIFFFRVKCPYCPIEQSPSDARQIFFWSPWRLNASCLQPNTAVNKKMTWTKDEVFFLMVPHVSWCYWIFWNVLGMKISNVDVVSFPGKEMTNSFLSGEASMKNMTLHFKNYQVPGKIAIYEPETWIDSGIWLF